jgi:putative transposase
MTTRVALEYSDIAIEDLNVKGMVKLRSIARSVSDQSFFEIRRQLEYKAILYGSTVTIVDRWFPSSKTCSGCGAVKKELKLSDRVFDCSVCGLQIDRDTNASINLRNQIGRGASEFTCVESVGTSNLIESRIAR